MDCIELHFSVTLLNMLTFTVLDVITHVIGKQQLSVSNTICHFKCQPE